MINKIVKAWENATQNMKEEGETKAEWEKFFENEKSFYGKLIRFTTPDEEATLAAAYYPMLAAYVELKDLKEVIKDRDVNFKIFEERYGKELAVECAEYEVKRNFERLELGTPKKIKNELEKIKNCEAIQYLEKVCSE